MAPTKFRSFGHAVAEEKNFFNQPIKNKNCLWQPCLLTDWDEIKTLNRGPSIDASYYASDHLPKRFQRRRFKCEKLIDDRSDAKSSHGFPGELKISKK